MTRKHIHARLSLVILASLLLAACSAQQATPPAVPTLDPNAIYTQAAETVAAGQAMTEAARPSPAATETLAPTATMDPAISTALTATAQAVLQPGAATATLPAAGTLAPTATGQAGLLPSATPATGSTPLVLPTATKAGAQPPPATGDKCEWVSNSPADGAKLPKNSSFDVVIKVRNNGTTTWTNKYALRYFGGERMGTPTDLLVTREVKPNDMYEFVFTMTMPGSTGKKEVLLVVQNAEGRNMCWINLPYEVTD